MKKILAVLAALCLITVARADQFTVTNGQTIIAVPASISSMGFATMTNAFWRSNTAYTAGSIVKVFGQAYFCRYAGTSGATNGVFSGAQTATDGTVTWVKTTIGDRNAILLQRVSGGTLNLNFANGSIRFGADREYLFMTEPTAVYQGPITANASGSDVIVNALWY